MREPVIECPFAGSFVGSPAVIARGVVPPRIRLRDDAAEKHARAMKHVDRQTAVADRLRMKLRELERPEGQALRSKREAKRLVPVRAAVQRQIADLWRGARID